MEIPEPKEKEKEKKVDDIKEVTKNIQKVEPKKEKLIDRMIKLLFGRHPNDPLGF